MPAPDEASAVAVAGTWVDLAAASTAATTQATQTVATSLWSGFTDWHNAAAVAAVAAEVADLSTTGQNIVAGTMTEYIAQVTAYLRGTGSIPVPPARAPQIRGGIDLTTVHSRPATAYKLKYAFTEDVDEAIQAAFEREMELLEADLALAARESQDSTMFELDVTHYRRVLRPELSQSGPCGLCIAASTQVYTVGDLLPLHGRCVCKTMPIVDGLDPAELMNGVDLKALYAAADSTAGQDLKKVRYQVNEHGELGPVLSVRGQKFTGPDDLAHDQDADRARRQLATLEPVLASLERRAAAGEDVTGPLGYQRNLIARLRRIAATH